MDAASLQDRLAHVVVTTVTPFDADGQVDLDVAGTQARFLADHGIRVVVPGGNTGEFTSLGLDEVTAVLARVVDAVADRCTVVAGVGWSSPIAVELARDAQAAGAHAVMVHHPVHTYVHPVGLRRYYERIIDAVDIGVVLYKRGPQLTDALIAELAEHERVVAVKYAVNDPVAFAALVERCEAPVTWLCGTAERWAPFFTLAGAQGFTSGLANVAPDRALALHERLAAGDLPGAMKLRAELCAFEELRQANGGGDNVPIVKTAMRLVGRDTGAVRDPLTELAPAALAHLREILVGWGLEVATP